MQFSKTIARFLLTLVCLSVPGLAATRHYYIAAEYVTWNYAPSGRDLIDGRPLPAMWADHLKYPKIRYIEYTDNTFATKKPQPEWLGILGPIIRAEVGDTVIVDFLNRTREPHGIHPHGLRYDKANEGAVYLPFGAGASVPPAGKFTYHWLADAGSGPGPGDSSSVVWWYHAHVDPSMETNDGLLGPIIVTAAGKARPDGSPKDVDREFIALFMIFDEDRGQASGLYHTINGYIFGNLPGLVMKQGEKVRWYLLGMGNEQDLHTAHWHGKTVTHAHRHTDVVELLPASMTSADMVADNPGTWMLHCHVADHMEAGMMVAYTILAPAARSCPVKFKSGDFWQNLGSPPTLYGEPSIEITNTGAQSIRKVTLLSGYFVNTPQYLRRTPYRWTSTQTIAPQASATLKLNDQSERNHLRAFYSDDIAGLMLYPERIEFSDGKVWTSKDFGECFGAIWRDKNTHQLLTLPPLQPEDQEAEEEEE